MPLGESDTKTLEILHQHAPMDFVRQRYSPSVLRTVAAGASHIVWLAASLISRKKSLHLRNMISWKR
jgi:hypothetical protein